MKYYDILEVDRDASQAEIKAAYREKVKETHPDQSDHPNAAQRFIQVKEAYDVLGDPEQRAAYDQHGISGSEVDSGPSSETSQSTAEADAEGVGWHAYTRGSESAEQMWDGVHQQSEKPPGVDDIAGSAAKVTVGKVFSGVAGGVLGLEIGMYLLSWVQPEPMSMIFTNGASVVGLLILTTIFLAVIVGIEQLLGTRRQILPT